MSYDEQKFAALVDDILRKSDLNTISAKRIRNALSEALGYDISEHKVRAPDQLQYNSSPPPSTRS